MNKNQLSKKLLVGAMVVDAVYIVVLLVLTFLQDTFKVMQNAPASTRQIFYFPMDEVLVAGIALAVMAAFAVVLFPKLAAKAKLGRVPAFGMVMFGVVLPICSAVASKLEQMDARNDAKRTVEYLIAAECVGQVLEWVTPLLYISAALFVAGCAFALCAREE